MSLNRKTKSIIAGKNDSSGLYLTKKDASTQLIPKRTVDRQNLNRSQKLCQQLSHLEKATDKKLQSVDNSQKHLQHELMGFARESKSEFLDIKLKPKGRRSSAPLVSLTNSSRTYTQSRDDETVSTNVTIQRPSSRRSSAQPSLINSSRSQVKESVTMGDLKTEMPRYLRCRVDEQSEDFDLFSGIN